MLTNATVLVTGSSGFIGSHLVDALLENGATVIGLSRSYPLRTLGLSQFANARYLPLEGDIRDETMLQRIFQEHQPTQVVHLAAQALVGNASGDASATFETNIMGTWRLLEAVRNYGTVQRIVIASSDKAYGNQDELPYLESMPLKAVFPYDVSKRITEQLALSYFHTYGLPVAITRCGNTFGPYDLNASRIVPGTIRACLEGTPVRLRSDGQSERCYVYVKDVVQAYLMLILAEAKTVVGQAFNVGNHTPISVLQLAKSICEATSRPDLKPLVLANAKHEIDRQSLDCQKIASLLGWRETHDQDEAMAETVNWYKRVFNQIEWQS